MSNDIVGKVYNRIIENVIAKSSVEFEAVGNTPEDLENIRKAWRDKLSKLHIASFPWDPPRPVPEPVVLPESVTAHTPEPALKTEVQHTPEPAQPVPAVRYQPSPSPVEYQTAPSRAQVQPAPRSELAGTIKIKLESIEDDVQDLKRAAQKLPQTELPPQKRVKRMPMPPQGSSAQLHPKTPDIPQLDGNDNDEVTELLTQKRVNRTPKSQGSSAQLHPKTPDIPQLDGKDNDEVTSDAARGARHIAFIESLSRFEVDYRLDHELLQTSLAASIQSPIIPQLDGNDSNPETTQSEGKDDDLEAAQSEGQDDDPDAINSDLDDSDDEYDPDAAQDENEMPQIMLCTYEKVTRSKSKWKCVLKNGVMTLNGLDYVFHKGVGEYEW
ncbi:transcription factor IIA subunit alpha [Rhizina undulata]